MKKDTQYNLVQKPNEKLIKNRFFYQKTPALLKIRSFVVILHQE